MLDFISEPQNYKKPIITIGEEFVGWAETYWHVDELFNRGVKNPDEGGGEICPYAAVRPIFIKKINDLIEERVRHYM